MGKLDIVLEIQVYLASCFSSNIDITLRGLHIQMCKVKSRSFPEDSQG